MKDKVREVCIYRKKTMEKSDRVFTEGVIEIGNTKMKPIFLQR